MAPRVRKNPAAVALGRRGGSMTSTAKTAAAQANGAKGGRPVLTHIKGTLLLARPGVRQSRCGREVPTDRIVAPPVATCSACQADWARTLRSLPDAFPKGAK